MLTTTLQTIWNLLPKDENGKLHPAGLQNSYWEGLLEGLGKTGPDGEPVTLLRILERCGMKCALTTINAFPEHSRAIRLFVCYCAKPILLFFEEKHPEETFPRQAFEAAERFARGLGSAEAAADALSHLRDHKLSSGLEDDGLDTLKHIADQLLRENGGSIDFSRNSVSTTMIAEVYQVAMNAMCRFDEFYWYDDDYPAWNLASEASEAKRREEQFLRLANSFGVSAYLRREFIRFCTLEGEYGEVDRK